MDVADRVYHDDDLPEPARGYGRDTVTLGWESRVQGHGRRRSDGGVEFGTSLPRGTVLREGDGLVLEAARLVVFVVEKPEPVVLIEPKTPQEWALFAYHIGNRHQPLMITANAIVCPDTAGMEQLLQQLHVPYRRTMHPFTPAATAPSHHH